MTDNKKHENEAALKKAQENETAIKKAHDADHRAETDRKRAEKAAEAPAPTAIQNHSDKTTPPPSGQTAVTLPTPPIGSAPNTGTADRNRGDRIGQTPETRREGDRVSPGSMDMGNKQDMRQDLSAEDRRRIAEQEGADRELPIDLSEQQPRIDPKDKTPEIK